MKNATTISCVILSEAKLQRSPENIRDEARLSISVICRPIARGKKPEMFESLASCFGFRCRASLNMTHGLCQCNSNRFHMTNPIRVEQMFPGFPDWSHNYEM
jgi:hypothetical protein